MYIFLVYCHLCYLSMLLFLLCHFEYEYIFVVSKIEENSLVEYIFNNMKLWNTQTKVKVKETYCTKVLLMLIK